MRSIIPLIVTACVLSSSCSSSSDSNNNNPAPPPPPPATYAISGSIVVGSGTSLEDITVTASGPVSATAITDVAGNFQIDGLSPGSYSVATTRGGSVFDPISQDVTVQDSDVPGLVFSVHAPEEGLSTEDLERLDATPESSLPESEVVLPNESNLEEYLNQRGITIDEITPVVASAKAVAHPVSVAPSTGPLPDATGPQQKKNDVVAKMLAQARYLSCGRGNPRCETWDFPAAADDPATANIDESQIMPAQEGLTYVYGGKDATSRVLPSDGCPEKTHGLDCSGLIYRLASSVGITLPVGSASTQADPESWVIPDDWQLEMKLVSDGSTQSGDIIAWPGHIGIAESGVSNTNVISATGTPGQCSANIAPPRGPRSLSLSVFGTPSARLRLVTTLSGTFDMGIRCADQITEAAVIRFEIDNNDGGPFSATGTGTDYDGSPLCFNLDGDYDQIENNVSALLTLCDNTRQDSFDVTLLQDDTGYFPLVKTIDNGGCVAEARLTRIQDSPTSETQSNKAREGDRTRRSGSRFSGPSTQ